MDVVALADSTSDRVEFFAACASQLEARQVLEVGVWEGEFAARILAACPGIERYWMLDPWRHLQDWDKPFNIDDDLFEAAYRKALDVTEFAADRRAVLRGTTGEMIGEIPDESIDIAYVDGDHTLRGIAVDLLRVWPKIRKGGVIVGDDFTPSIWQHGPRFEPSCVFPFAVYFAEAMGVPIAALSGEQFAITKSSDGFSFADPRDRYGDLGLKGQLSPVRQARSLAGHTARELSERLGRAS